jgi:hydrogenase nickel incorporation protein HypB
MTEIAVGKDVLHDNAEDARANRERFDRAGVYVLTVMSGPGAGKTTLLEKTAEALKSRLRLAIVTGDLETRRDADRLGRHGIPALQINTGGACHIEAHQIARACDSLELGRLDVLIIENVGNLVCPAEFELGEHDRAMLLSCAEGHDKPGKYPLMFRQSRAMLLNKTDLLPYTDFDVGAAVADARALNPELEVLELSARTGAGLEEWFSWIERRRATVRAAAEGR